MSIGERLKNPLTRGGSAPHFECIDLPSADGRNKRVRFWAGSADGPNVLPWIALNPSGQNDDGYGASGLAFVRFAWLWGFDGVAVYNIYPFKDPEPIVLANIIALAKQRNDQTVEDAIAVNHAYIADDLLGSDAAMLGWGSGGGRVFRDETKVRAASLVRMIQNSGSSPRSRFETWCLGTTRHGDPLHPLYKPSTLRPRPISF